LNKQEQIEEQKAIIAAYDDTLGGMWDDLLEAQKRIAQVEAQSKERRKVAVTLQLECDNQKKVLLEELWGRIEQRVDPQNEGLCELLEEKLKQRAVIEELKAALEGLYRSHTNMGCTCNVCVKARQVISKAEEALK